MRNANRVDVESIPLMKTIFHFFHLLYDNYSTPSTNTLFFAGDILFFASIGAAGPK